MTKYNNHALQIGDKVRVKNLKEFDYLERPNISPHMHFYIGQETVITFINEGNEYGPKIFKINGNDFSWLEKWLERI